VEISGAEAVFDALNRAGVAYLVVGGLAVNAHGYVRMTMDIDLVIALNSENILKALRTLDVEYARAWRLNLREGLSVPIVSLDTLLTMKREAGRPQDLADIDALLEVADHGR
jgi:hypothetical protein